MTVSPDPPQKSGSPARRRYATAIEDYLAGKIDNFALDEAYLETPFDDEVCRRLGAAMWRCYSDVRAHRHEDRHRLTADMEAMVRRWIEILRTDAEWEWERASVGDWLRQAGVTLHLIKRPAPNYFWPFADGAAWKEWKGRLARPPVEG